MEGAVIGVGPHCEGRPARRLLGTPSAVTDADYGDTDTPVPCHRQRVASALDRTPA
jgi:hypothetical protein